MSLQSCQSFVDKMDHHLLKLCSDYKVDPKLYNYLGVFADDTAMNAFAAERHISVPSGYAQHKDLIYYRCTCASKYRCRYFVYALRGYEGELHAFETKKPHCHKLKEKCNKKEGGCSSRPCEPEKPSFKLGEAMADLVRIVKQLGLDFIFDDQCIHIQPLEVVGIPDRWLVFEDPQGSTTPFIEVTKVADGEMEMKEQWAKGSVLDFTKNFDALCSSFFNRHESEE